MTELSSVVEVHPEIQVHRRTGLVGTVSIYFYKSTCSLHILIQWREMDSLHGEIKKMQNRKL